MLELTRKPTTGKYAEIHIRMPAEQALNVIDATKGFWRLAGHEVRELNEDGEELYSVEEVFGNITPGRVLRGTRLREEMTQADLAKVIGCSRSHISEMEHDKRPIGKKCRHLPRKHGKQSFTP